MQTAFDPPATMRSRQLLLGVLCAWISAVAQAASPEASALANAVHRGDCNAAFRLLNPDIGSNDAQAAFLTGRLLEEGICVRPNPTGAALYYARSAALGNHAAALDYAASVGLGAGSPQSYERAGTLCRSAGLDPQARSSPYALGYACTVRAVAGRLLRTRLPKGAFQSGSRSAQVIFTPASGGLTLKSTSPVGYDDAATGSIVREPLVDAEAVIGKAWVEAMAALPAPDRAQLDAQPVELSLDLDMSLEVGRALQHADTGELKPFMPGDLLPLGAPLSR